MNDQSPRAPQEVVYLTGAPGTGKSTLAQSLEQRFSNVMIFSYGARMVQRLRSLTRGVANQAELRGGTDPLVTVEDIRAVDQDMVEWVNRNRDGRLLLIDTHQVTLEHNGLRFVPFEPSMLLDLSLTVIWVLSTSESTVVERVSADPVGRIIPTHADAVNHAATQLAVAVQYAVSKGIEMRVFDANADMDELSARVVASLARGKNNDALGSRY